MENEKFISYLKTLEADLFVVVAFRKLPKSIWTLPKYGTINLHTSLLPNYRGAAPINRVLINDEKVTGLTTFFIDEKIDCGEIISQEKINLSDNTTAAQLHNIMMKKGSELLNKTIDLIHNNNFSKFKQENKLAEKEIKKLTKELTKINWKNDAKEIHNLVRGLSPFLSENEILKDISICPSAGFILQTKMEKRYELN